jgi:hypothetical protein
VPASTPSFYFEVHVKEKNDVGVGLLEVTDGVDLLASSKSYYFTSTGNFIGNSSLIFPLIFLPLPDLLSPFSFPLPSCFLHPPSPFLLAGPST